VIVSNPPFHDGAHVRADLGRSFIKVAAQALNRAGVLWLVANRHLAYEQLLASEFARVRTVVQAHGFKVFEAVKSGERQRQGA
jgi:16S rRNA (guanine1207-N2)-methyltransferase